MKKGLFFSLVMPLIICSAGLLTAQQICSNQNGEVGNGYHYELWTDGAGSACMTVKGVAAQFETEWVNAGDFLALVGLQYDRSQTPPQIGTFSTTYACTFKPTGDALMGIHGWMTDPYIEYYIVDSWGTWQPPGSGLMHKGTITVDGALYDVYLDTHPISVDIMDGMKTYWSVRKSKRTSGTISISDHFSQWERLGMPLGKLYNVMLFIEGFQSSGNAVFTTAEITVSNGQTPTPTSSPTPTPTGEPGDVNGDGIINITDALLVAKYCGGIPVPATFIVGNADVNQDGTISIVDALKIAQYVAGLIQNF
jgi:endo-1,4-beta-xylanase